MSISLLLISLSHNYQSAQSDVLLSVLCQFLQVLVPVLVVGQVPAEHKARPDSRRLQPVAGGTACVIVVHTQAELPKARHPSQHTCHRKPRGAAAGHIAVVPPVFRMEGDIGEEIDGRLEHKEPVISS